MADHKFGLEVALRGSPVDGSEWGWDVGVNLYDQQRPPPAHGADAVAGSAVRSTP